jgi:hypothetical protein
VNEAAPVFREAFEIIRKPMPEAATGWRYQASEKDPACLNRYFYWCAAALGAIEFGEGRTSVRQRYLRGADVNVEAGTKSFLLPVCRRVGHLAYVLRT